jgi:hypothetical protein
VPVPIEELTDEDVVGLGVVGKGVVGAGVLVGLTVVGEGVLVGLTVVGAGVGQIESRVKLIDVVMSPIVYMTVRLAKSVEFV